MSETDSAEALDAAVSAAFESEQVPFLKALVEQPSCSREPEDVEAAAQLLDAAAQDLGLEVTRHPVATGERAAHRVYRTAATREDDRGLLLIGHIDTVFPRSQGFFGFRRDGDTIRGPGVLDMKSGLSSVIYALGAVKRVAPSRFAALRARFLVNTDEEVGSATSRSLIEAVAAQSTRALVFEAGRDEDRIITRRKGTGIFHVTVHGRAAHAGLHHEEGVNAIHALSLLVPRIEALTDYARGRTVNVGIVAGGTAQNAVPAEARLTLDVRFERAEDGEDVVEALRALVASPPFEGRLREATVELEGTLSRPPLTASPESQALRQAYEVHAAAVGLSTGEAPLQGGGSDANIASGVGCPAIDGLGPYGKHFHREDEWSSLSSLERRTKALARFLWAEGAGG